MAADKKVFVNQIREGQAVEDIFMVRKMVRSETRSGNPYLIMTLMDRSGEIDARLWENVDNLMEVCRPGGLVQIAASAQEFRGSLQLKVDSVLNVDREEADSSLFMPATRKNIEEMARKVKALARSIKTPFYLKLLEAFFADPAFTKQFLAAPAAKSMHHAYLGGLLEHTLAVAQLAEMLADFYPALNRDLLLTGALLHDVGKTKEFAFDSFPYDYTDMGRLVGHLVLGTDMVRGRIKTISGFPEDLSTRLQHLILSHHGRHEFGSPSLPMISEAFVLHFIDDLDAKLNFIGGLEERASEPGYQWTDFQRVLDRFLFINGRPAEEAGVIDPETGQASSTEPRLNSKQQQLF